MNANELHELVRDVPGVCGGLVFCIDDERGAYWELAGVGPITVGTAADLILAGVVRKLAEHGACIHKTRTGFSCHATHHGPPNAHAWAEHGPTELHAALAAYRKLKG
jgi:hypothetical protein